MPERIIDTETEREAVTVVKKVCAWVVCAAVMAAGPGTCTVKAESSASEAEKDADGVKNGKEEKSSAGQDTGLPQLRIGSAVFDPYFYVDEDGDYAGVDVDIATKACERMGYEAVFTELVWGEHDTLLESGDIDCVWCSFAMNGREREYQWAGPYLYSPEVVVVAADSEIESLEDLEGKSVAVEVDSRPEDYFLNSEEGISLNVKNVQTYSSLDDAFTSFGKGYADAVAGHKMALEHFTSEKPELYRVLEPEIINAKLGVAFANEDKSGLVTKLSETLDEMNQDGTIAEIAAKYGFSEDMLVKQQTEGGSSE